MARSFGKIVGNLFFFVIPVVFLAFCALMISMTDVWGSLDPNALDRSTLIRVMQWRDFRYLSPELLERMTARCEAEFGRNGQKPSFEFSELEKKIHISVRQNRKNKSNKQNDSKAFLETNLMLMARTRYFQWMSLYETLADSDRPRMLGEVVEDMQWWQSIYLDYLRAIELPIPTIAELIREFDEMIENFKIGATPEEIVRIDFFKNRLNSAFLAHGVQGAVENISGNVSSALSKTLGTLLLGKPKKNEDKSPVSNEKQGE